ncbi:MAG: Holliday junction resolvase RuvX [Verrucomicrobiales bacterium]|nr:Holliday junction resolvase RuvX [Verrucomicrobiales bacterium]
MTDNWVKALGIDYGKVRIGLAVSDDLGMLAHPLKTIPGNGETDPAELIAQVVNERGIKDLVIGMPYHSDGRESTISKEVSVFITKLKEKLGDNFPIHEVDELMTTKTAREKLRQAGRKQRETKGILDQAAAAEILQDWLNRRADSAFPEIDLYPDED